MILILVQVSLHRLILIHVILLISDLDRSCHLIESLRMHCVHIIIIIIMSVFLDIVVGVRELVLGLLLENIVVLSPVLLAKAAFNRLLVLHGIIIDWW